MEPSKTHKSRLPRLISRPFKRASSKNTNPPKGPADRHAPKAHCSFFKKLGFGARPSKIPRPKTPELRSQYPAGAHGGGCFPSLFKRSVKVVVASKAMPEDIAKALPPLPRAPTQRSHITRGSHLGIPSRGPTRIPNPTQLRCIRESFDFIDISPKSEHPSAFESRRSQHLDLATVAASGYPATIKRQDIPRVEPSNVSLDVINASPDASINVNTDSLTIDIVQLLPVPNAHPANAISSIPFPTAIEEALLDIENDSQECDLATPASTSDEVLDGLDTPTTLPTPPTPHKIEAFGTNPVLADDIVQDFIETNVASRRRRRLAQANIPIEKLVEILALLEDRVFTTAVDELEVAVEASIIIKNNSISPSNISSAEDSPTFEELSPVISFVDSASVYSCSSAPYSDHEAFFAMLSQKESGIEIKPFEAPLILCEEEDEAQEAGPSSTYPRSLAARRAHPNLFISIPHRAPDLPIALSSGDSDNEVIHSSTTERLNGLRASRTASATFVPFRPASSSFSSCSEEAPVVVPETSAKRRNRRQGTIYGIPPVPSLDTSRFDDPASSSSCSTPGPVSTPSGGSVSESRSSIFYRSEPKFGLRPLMLPKLAGEGKPNNGLRSILKRPALRKEESPVSTLSSSENISSSLSTGTAADDASPFFRPLLLSEPIKGSENVSSDLSGTCENEGASPIIQPTLSEGAKCFVYSDSSSDSESDRVHQYLRPLLLPDHIKIRRSISRPRPHPQPGPAF
ncbi:hypothetical protein GALMADRAFT_144912 [Galerina marginata CBS 339.88]|uniref:Uncharacterized protein n=1 Tax=Galerina marginata (strain CBS 339.88) TaxID=685588 RepID=A0A067SH19_GALM3|nr:hypothetical protein GALMADRAFT_144912 [Galerina marginata CBS 339.88]